MKETLVLYDRLNPLRVTSPQTVTQAQPFRYKLVDINDRVSEQGWAGAGGGEGESSDRTG